MYASAHRCRGGIKTTDKTPDYVTYRELNKETEKVHASVDQKIGKVKDDIGEELVRLWSTVAKLQEADSEIRRDIRDIGKDLGGMYQKIISLLVLILLALIGIMLDVPGLVGIVI